MRTYKLNKGHSTKAERRFHELLKKLHINFKSKIKINGKEVDFLIGKYAIEIDGHSQNVKKNYLILNAGYTPIHFNNNEINDHLIEWLKQICQEQIYLRQNMRLQLRCKSH